MQTQQKQYPLPKKMFFNRCYAKTSRNFPFVIGFYFFLNKPIHFMLLEIIVLEET